MIDFLVVGFGIAGVAVAHELEKRNLSFLVVDPGNNSEATTCAGGIINPVTGRKFALQWNIEQLLLRAKSTYGSLQETLQISTYRTTEIIRLHKSAEALNAWKANGKSASNPEWIIEFDASRHIDSQITNQFGGVTILNALQVFPQHIVDAYRKLLIQKNQLITATLHHADLQLGTNNMRWNSATYRNIIFCEGYAAIKNPLLQFLQFKPAKGQYLILHIPGLQTTYTYQKEIALVPLGNEIFWAGATNEWEHLDDGPTPHGLHQLQTKLSALLEAPYRILQHGAGIRPTMKNRMPVIGRHPAHPNIFIFNGLGTKGFSLAPYYAPLLIDHITQNSPLPVNVNQPLRTTG